MQICVLPPNESTHTGEGDVFPCLKEATFRTRLAGFPCLLHLSTRKSLLQLVGGAQSATPLAILTSTIACFLERFGPTMAGACCGRHRQSKLCNYVYAIKKMAGQNPVFRQCP